MSTKNLNNLEKKMKHFKGCPCEDLRIVRKINDDDFDYFIVEKGPHKASGIKKLIGIKESKLLVEKSEDKPLHPYQDDDKVYINGCETFLPGPKGAGNSKTTIEEELLKEPFGDVFGTSPILVKEAGIHHLILEGVPVGPDKKVDLCLEWPLKNRLLVSEKIDVLRKTPLNWPPNYKVRVAGRNWHGVSLKTEEKTPLNVLQSYLQALVNE